MKISSVIPLLILLAFCKNNTGQKQANTTTTPFDRRLDSISLINDLAYISDSALEGREAGTAGNATARAFIVARFDSLGLNKPDTSFLQSFSRQSGISGTNVIGIISGTEFPDQYYVLSAHYDHLGKKNGRIYPGADDNASGTACLLAMARYFKQHPPRHSLIIAAFDAEEKGLVGSRYFADHPVVSLNKILLNVNMDMVSRNDHNEIYACGIYHYPFLKKYVDSAQKRTEVQIKFGHDNPTQGSQDWTSQSDHYPFHLKHIPFLYFGVEDHQDYHQPGDTFTMINKSFYYQVCNMIAETVLELDAPGETSIVNRESDKR